jgi:hypothetical protein
MKSHDSAKPGLRGEFYWEFWEGLAEAALDHGVKEFLHVFASFDANLHVLCAELEGEAAALLEGHDPGFVELVAHADDGHGAEGRQFSEDGLQLLEGGPLVQGVEEDESLAVLDPERSLGGVLRLPGCIQHVYVQRPAPHVVLLEVGVQQRRTILLVESALDVPQSQRGFANPLPPLVSPLPVSPAPASPALFNLIYALSVNPHFNILPPPHTSPPQIPLATLFKFKYSHF